MKHRVKILIISGLALLLYGHSQAQNLETFRMQGEMENAQNIRRYYKSSEEFTLANKTSISGLSVSGKVKFKDEFGLLRIILEDEKGNEFLVFESSPMFANSNELSFDNVSDETVLLNDVKASKIKVALKNAEVYIESIGMSNKPVLRVFNLSGLKKEKARAADVRLKAKIRSINEYNLKNEEFWVAGETPLARLSYADKKKMIGTNSDDFNTQGYEYYASGIFVIKSENKNNHHVSMRVASNYIADFDWRDRHGVNWNTSIKHQGYKNPTTNIGGGACWVFAPIACAEAYTNLYFNKRVDLDLSEQDVLNCVPSGSVTYGGDPEVSMKHITEKGVIKESDLPFQNNQTPCVNFPENKRTRFGAMGTVIANSNVTKEEIFKKALINQGPLSATVLVWSLNWHHTMLLVGYGKIRAGMKVRLSNNTTYITVPTSSPHIGKTYWIYKNSYGEDNAVSGYHYLIFDDYTHMGSYAYYFTGNVTTPGYTTSSRMCNDKDGDGFYTWFGPKPSNAPSGQAISDGDDTDSDLGVLSADGRCTINPGVKAFTENTSINSSLSYAQHIRVLSDVTLTVNSGVLKANGKRLTLEKYAVLNVSSGTLDF